MAKKLELYHFESCPYCVKVRNYIDRAGLRDRIVFYDILRDAEAADRLEQMTGDDQVPCLVIDGQPMLESDDIIDWLRENAKTA